MKRIHPRVILVTTVAFLSTMLLLLIAYAAPSVGDKAPGFKLTSIDGEIVSLADLQKDSDKRNSNRVVLVDFWATWCPPCRKSIPYLQKLYEKYSKKGFIIAGIALDNGGIDDVKPFAKEYKLTYTILVDPQSIAAKSYGVRPIPTMFLIDKKGIVRMKRIGFAPGMEKELENEIKTLLK